MYRETSELKSQADGLLMERRHRGRETREGEMLNVSPFAIVLLAGNFAQKEWRL